MADMINRGRNRVGDQPYRNGSSGVRGVHRAKHGRWEAFIARNGRRIRLGTFATVAEAAAARKAAEEKYSNR